MISQIEKIQQEADAENKVALQNQIKRLTAQINRIRIQVFALNKYRNPTSYERYQLLRTMGNYYIKLRRQLAIHYLELTGKETYTTSQVVIQ